MALMDYVRPRWKHSDPEIRAATLRVLEDDRQDVFLFAALDDPDPSLRQQAAKRVTREDALRRLLEKSTDQGVVESARKNLNRALAESLKAAKSAEAEKIRSGLEELKADAKSIEDVARAALSPETRRAASALLVHGGAILAVALEEKLPDIALAALARIDRESYLRSASKNARCREVREAAKEKLKALEGAKKPDASALNRAKLQVLLIAAEKADTGSAAPNPAFPWDATGSQVDEAESALRELMASGLRVELEVLARFRGQVSAFRSRHDGRLAVKNERETVETEARRTREIEDERRLVREHEEAERKKEQIALGRAEAEREQAETAATAKIRKEEEEKRAEAWRRAAAEAETWIAELNAMSESPNLHDADKRAREIHRLWKARFSAATRETGELSRRYREAADRLWETLGWHRWSNHRRKQDICAKLEALQPLENARSVVPKFRELLDEWRSVGQVPWEEAEALRERFRKTCDVLYEKSREYYAELDVERRRREENAKLKEDLCLEAESLRDSTEWRAAIEKIKALQVRWKVTGPAPRDADQKYWRRFRAACDAFFDRLGEHSAKRDQDRQGNLEAKLELIRAAEALVEKPEGERGKIVRELHGKWKRIGPVPPAQIDYVWDRFSAACDAAMGKPV